MSANLNCVHLIGRVVRDPEIRFTSKGTAVCELSLAITRIWQDESGTKQEESTFVECVFWARQAEVCGQYAKKGSPLYVQGRLQLDTWDDKQTGQKRSRLRVLGEHLQLLGSKPPGEGAPSEAPPRIRESIDRMRQAVSGAGSVGGSDDPLDIPFDCDRG
jgi:single-strand DNA-binding protein